jgi:hypothetical protein
LSRSAKAITRRYIGPRSGFGRPDRPSAAWRALSGCTSKSCDGSVVSLRALLSADSLNPGQGNQTQFAVAIATFGLFDADEEPTCPSELWQEPFTVGLPSEFARAVASALDEGPGLPAGTLTIDRAGFDLVNSSEMIFGQAAAVLKTVMAAQLSGRDADAAARSLVSTW